MSSLSQFNLGFTYGIFILLLVLKNDTYLVMFELGFLTGISAFFYIESKSKLSYNKFLIYKDLEKNISLINLFLTTRYTRLKFIKKRYNIIIIQKYYRTHLVYKNYKKLVNHIIFIQACTRKWKATNSIKGILNRNLEVCVKTCWDNLDEPIEIKLNIKKDIVLFNKLKYPIYLDVINKIIKSSKNVNIWFINNKNIINKNRLSVIVLGKHCKNYPKKCLCYRCRNYRKFYNKIIYKHTNPNTIRRIKEKDILLGFTRINEKIIITNKSYCLSNNFTPLISCFYCDSLSIITY